MSERRLLILAVVTDLHDVSVTYPSCQRCCSKLLVDTITQRFHCIKCGTNCIQKSVQWRYRLVVSVSDGSTLGKLVVFGRTLDGFFGKSATDFRRSLDDLEQTGYPSESLLMEALNKTFYGKYFYFGFKLTGSMTSSSSPNLSDVLKTDSNKGLSQFDSSSSFENSHALAYQMLASNNGVYATVTDHMRFGVKRMRTAHLKDTSTAKRSCLENNEQLKVPLGTHSLSRNLSTEQNSSIFCRTMSFNSKQESVLFSFENSSSFNNSKSASSLSACSFNRSAENTATDVLKSNHTEDITDTAEDDVMLKEWENSFHSTFDCDENKKVKQAMNNFENKLISSHEFCTPINVILSQCNSTFSQLPVSQKLNFDDSYDSNTSNTCSRVDKELRKREVTFSQRFFTSQNVKEKSVFSVGELEGNKINVQENHTEKNVANKTCDATDTNASLSDSVDDELFLQAFLNDAGVTSQLEMCIKNGEFKHQAGNITNGGTAEGSRDTNIVDTTVHSDKTCVSSDKSSIHSDKTSIHSDNRTVHSDNRTVQIDNRTVHSDNRTIRSDKMAVHSDKATVHSDKTMVLSDKRPVHSDETAVHSDKITVHNDKTIVLGDKRTGHGDNPTALSDKRTVRKQIIDTVVNDSNKTVAVNKICKEDSEKLFEKQETSITDGAEPTDSLMQQHEKEYLNMPESEGLETFFNSQFEEEISFTAFDQTKIIELAGNSVKGFQDDSVIDNVDEMKECFIYVSKQLSNSSNINFNVTDLGKKGHEVQCVIEDVNLPESEDLETFFDLVNNDIERNDFKLCSSNFGSRKTAIHNGIANLRDRKDTSHRTTGVDENNVIEQANGKNRKHQGNTSIKKSHDLPNSEDLEDFLNDISDEFKETNSPEYGNSMLKSFETQQSVLPEKLIINNRGCNALKNSVTDDKKSLQDSTNLEDYFAELSIVVDLDEVKEDNNGIQDGHIVSKDERKTPVSHSNDVKSIRLSRISTNSMINEDCSSLSAEMSKDTQQNPSPNLKGDYLVKMNGHTEDVEMTHLKVLDTENEDLINHTPHYNNSKLNVHSDFFSDSSFEIPDEDEDLNEAILSCHSDIFGDSMNNSKPGPAQSKLYMCMFSKKLTAKNATEKGKQANTETPPVRMDTKASNTPIMNMSEDLFDLSNMNINTEVSTSAGEVRTPILNGLFSQFGSGNSASEFELSKRLFDTSTPGLNQCILDSQELEDASKNVDENKAMFTDNGGRRTKSRRVKFDQRLRRVSSCHLMDIKMRLNSASPLLTSEKLPTRKTCLKQKSSIGRFNESSSKNKAILKQIIVEDVTDKSIKVVDDESENGRKDTKCDSSGAQLDMDNSNWMVDSFGSQDLFSPSPVLANRVRRNMFKLNIERSAVENVSCREVGKSRTMQGNGKQNTNENTNVQTPDLWGDESASFLVCADVVVPSSDNSGVQKMEQIKNSMSKKKITITSKINIKPTDTHNNDHRHFPKPDKTQLGTVCKAEENIFVTTPDIFSPECAVYHHKKSAFQIALDKQNKENIQGSQTGEPVKEETKKKKIWFPSKGSVNFQRRLVLKCLVNNTPNCDSNSSSVRPPNAASTDNNQSKTLNKTSLNGGDKEKQNFVEDSPDIFGDSPLVETGNVVCDNLSVQNVPLGTSDLCKKLFF